MIAFNDKERAELFKIGFYDDGDEFIYSDDIGCYKSNEKLYHLLYDEYDVEVDTFDKLIEEFESIMTNIFKKFNHNMSNYDFLELILKLDSIDDGTLCEYDDELLCDFYNKLYVICPRQIDNCRNVATILPNRGESISEFMIFLSHIGL